MSVFWLGKHKKLLNAAAAFAPQTPLHPAPFFSHATEIKMNVNFATIANYLTGPKTGKFFTAC